MKRITIFFASFVLIAASIGQAEPMPADAQVAALIKEIRAQQATMTDNQFKIDTRLAAVIEAVRVARIYSSRGGR